MLKFMIKEQFINSNLPFFLKILKDKNALRLRRVTLTRKRRANTLKTHCAKNDQNKIVVAGKVILLK